MAPINNRSTSPSQLPSWLRELLREMQLLHQDFQRQESSIREIRDINMEIQRLLRGNRHENPTISVRTRPLPIVTGSTRIARTATVTSSNAAKTAAIRDAAIALPRPTKVSSQATDRICWYHRQFGKTSQNCLLPCEFAKLVVEISPPKPKLSSAVIRVPLERTGSEKNKANTTSPSSSSASSSTSKDTDWNDLAEAHNQAKLSDSSSSSDSEETSTK